MVHVSTYQGSTSHSQLGGEGQAFHTHAGTQQIADAILRNTLPEFLDKRFGDHILVENKKFGLFLAHPLKKRGKPADSQLPKANRRPLGFSSGPCLIKVPELALYSQVLWSVLLSCSIAYRYTGQWIVELTVPNPVPILVDGSATLSLAHYLSRKSPILVG